MLKLALRGRHLVIKPAARQHRGDVSARVTVAGESQSR